MPFPRAKATIYDFGTRMPPAVNRPAGDPRAPGKNAPWDFYPFYRIVSNKDCHVGKRKDWISNPWPIIQAVSVPAPLYCRAGGKVEYRRKINS